MNDALYCVLVADPRGSGCFRPLLNTVSASFVETADKVRALRVAFPNGEWEVGMHPRRERCVVKGPAE